MRKFWNSEHLASENPWNSLGIMEFSILKYRVSILGVIRRVSYKNHPVNQSPAKPLMKRNPCPETAQEWVVGGSHRSPGCHAMLMLPRAAGRGGETAWHFVARGLDLSGDLLMVKRARGLDLIPFGVSPGEDAHCSHRFFLSKAEVWGTFELKWFWLAVIYWLWSVSDFVLLLYWSMIYHLTSNLYSIYYILYRCLTCMIISHALLSKTTWGGKAGFHL